MGSDANDHAASDDQLGAAQVRHVAPGGWRRALVGFLVGVLAGAVVALAMPRRDGPRRRSLVDAGG